MAKTQNLLFYPSVSAGWQFVELAYTLTFSSLQNDPSGTRTRDLRRDRAAL